MSKHEILFALLGHPGQLINSEKSEKGSQSPYKCTPLAKTLLNRTEVAAIDQIVHTGCFIRHLCDYVYYFDDLSCPDKYEAAFRLVLDEFIVGYEKKIASLEKDLLIDDALGLGFISARIADDREWIKTCHQIVSEEKYSKILEVVHQIDSANANLVHLKEFMHAVFIDEVKNFVRYGLDLPAMPSFISQLTAHQIRFIGKCVNEYKLIYIDMKLSDLESFEYDINSVFHEYNSALYNLCLCDFMKDIAHLDNLLLMENTHLEDYDKFVARSPIVTKNHIDSYKEMFSFLLKTTTAINSVNKEYAKRFSPYRIKLTQILHQIQLYQKVDIVCINQKYNTNKFTDLASSLEENLQQILSKLSELDSIVDKLLIKLPHRVRDTDYVDLYQDFIRSGCCELRALATRLNWNGWLNSSKAVT